MSKEKQIEELTNELIRTNSYGTLNAVAEHLYNAGYRKQEWISVEERLPEEGTRVLGYDYMGNVVCYFVYGTRWWVGDGWNSAKGWGVTHWMPLPSLPEKEKNDD